MKKDVYLDEVRAPIRAGTVAGNVILLQLTQPATAKTITYLSGRDWDGKPASLIFGANGIAALTFCEVGIAPSATADPPQVSFEPTLESLKAGLGNARIELDRDRSPVAASTKSSDRASATGDRSRSGRTFKTRS